jgi:hypothetical protein
MEDGMNDLGRLVGKAMGNFNSNRSGEQNNYFNKSTGTQNNNKGSHAPVYFGQNMRFYQGR